MRLPRQPQPTARLPHHPVHMAQVAPTAPVALADPTALAVPMVLLGLLGHLGRTVAQAGHPTVPPVRVIKLCFFLLGTSSRRPSRRFVDFYYSCLHGPT
jgi:hypothetical protein